MFVNIADDERIEQLRRTFDRVFMSADPFADPFHTSVESRAVMFPSDYFPYQKEYEALITAASRSGERTVYFSSIEGYGTRLPFGSPHRHFEYSVETPYADVTARLGQYGYRPVVESAFYSPVGAWGALTSRENHIVVGGSEEFLTVLGIQYDLDRAAREFLAWWKRNETAWQVDVSWVPGLMRRIYGDDRALRYLVEARFPGYD